MSTAFCGFVAGLNVYLVCGLIAKHWAWADSKILGLGEFIFGSLKFQSCGFCGTHLSDAESTTVDVHCRE